MSKVREHEPEGFPEFWSIYQPVARHTDGRGLAREAYRKQILRGAEPQDIIDGARWFVRNLSPRDRDGYVPLASTWLNREAYPDFAEKERAFQRRLAEQQTSENVTPIRKVTLPENHFSRVWERRKAGGE